MLSVEQRAKSTLKVYLDRGIEALSAIENQDWDQLDHIFKMRKAAFHNFKVMDSLYGSPTQEDQLFDLWKDVEQINKKLEKSIGGMSVGLRAQLSSLKKHKDKIGKFHSGSQNPTRFRNTV